jgi:CheY-like chemotaxis protein
MADDKKAGEKQKRIILVAVSDSNERNYTSMLVQRFGYHVCTVDASLEAAEFVSVLLPALVIADETLACSKDFDLLRNMKENPRTSMLPVILVSSSADMSAAQQYLDAGYAGVLRKPLNTDALYEAVQKATEPRPRKSIRVAVYLKADLGGNAAGFATYPVVLSENGMFVRTTATQPVDSRIPVSLVIKGRTVEVDAVVLYSYGFGDYPFKEPGMGLNFVRISPEDKGLIKLFIQEQMEIGIKRKP